MNAWKTGIILEKFQMSKSKWSKKSSSQLRIHKYHSNYGNELFLLDVDSEWMQQKKLFKILSINIKFFQVPFSIRKHTLSFHENETNSKSQILSN